MELALASTFRPLSPPVYTHFSRIPYTPSFLRRQLSPKPTLSRQTVIVTAQKKPKIDGLSDELNSIASQNLDHAPARRRVRSAFANVQQQLDHILFKVLFRKFSCSGVYSFRLPAICFWIFMSLSCVFLWCVDGTSWDQNRWGEWSWKTNFQLMQTFFFEKRKFTSFFISFGSFRMIMPSPFFSPFSFAS